MKTKLLLLFAFWGCASIAYGQLLGRDVISVSGGLTSNDGLMLSWTIGQSGLTGTLNGSNAILTQGFEQDNDDQFVAVIDVGQYDISVILFPNPVMDVARLKISSDFNPSFSWQLLDINGILINLKEKQQLPTGDFIEQIPSEELYPGMYYLQIVIFSTDNKPVSKTIKLIKL
jgi:hypothetical protein